MKVAGVVFAGGSRPYNYFIDEQLPGYNKDYRGFAIVSVSGIYKVVEIVDIIDEFNYCGVNPITAEIVSLVDDSFYKEKQELKQKQTKARKKLDEMLVKVEETTKYRMLLDLFPEAKDLIDLLSK